MRTTVDLPDDLHDAARSLAHERRQTFSQAVAEMARVRGAKLATVDRGFAAAHPDVAELIPT